MTKFERFVKESQRREESVPFENPLEIPCPRCDGALAYTGQNTKGTLAFLDCQGSCGHAYTVGVALAAKFFPA